MQKRYSFITTCLNSVTDSQLKFHCTTCNIHILCAYGSSNDAEIHINFEFPLNRA